MTKRILVLMAHPAATSFCASLADAYRAPGHHQIRRTILQYCGIHPVRITSIGRVKDTPDSWKTAWIERARGFGRKA
jgi:putative NADPH-quinone reductase